MERTVDSIQVGPRHRTEIGDLDDLVASIRDRGLLQPITVTPTGVLVCGARRLAAIKQLGWRTVNVWVRPGISTQLEHVLAEHDDHTLAKPLTQLEAATLYRELKQLLAEDAKQRETATRFSAENQPGTDGGGKFPPPSDGSDPGPVGKTREQAAGMIPGAASYKTLDKIGYLQHHAADESLPAGVRERLDTELQAIEEGGPVQPAYERARALIDQHHADRDAHLDDLARAALARAQQAKSKNKKKTPTLPSTPLEGVWPTRRFVLIWDELDSWWTHYDADILAAELTPEQVTAFLTVVDGSVAFADQLRAALETPDTDTGAGGGGVADDGAGVRHLRAL
ncbi:ParB N-terminal domain-containing protein [Mariniluteicoccus endophyticus]